MKQVQIAIAVVGCLLAVFGYFDNKSKMTTQIADLSRVVLFLKSAESTRVFNAKVDSAIAAHEKEALGGVGTSRHTRSPLRPTRGEIAKEVAAKDSVRSDSGLKQFKIDVEKVREYAKPRMKK